MHQNVRICRRECSTSSFENESRTAETTSGAYLTTPLASRTLDHQKYPHCQKTDRQHGRSIRGRQEKVQRRRGRKPLRPRVFLGKHDVQDRKQSSEKGPGQMGSYYSAHLAVNVDLWRSLLPCSSVTTTKTAKKKVHLKTCDNTIFGRYGH
jgi:hypothetical protein